MKVVILLGIVGLAVYLALATRTIDLFSPTGEAGASTATKQRDYIADVTAEEVPRAPSITYTSHPGGPAGRPGRVNRWPGARRSGGAFRTSRACASSSFVTRCR